MEIGSKDYKNRMSLMRKSAQLSIEFETFIREAGSRGIKTIQENAEDYKAGRLFNPGLSVFNENGEIDPEKIFKPQN